MVNLDKKWILYTLTWPIFVETTLRLLMGNVSVFMISHYSDTAVAAVGVSAQIVNMLIMIFGIVGTGTAIMISQQLGAGNHKSASQAVLVAIFANLIFGLLMSFMMILFAKNIVSLMNIEGDTLEYAALFLVIVGGSSFLQAIIATVGAIFRSFGHTKYPMIVALLMNVTNAIGDYISLFQPFGLPVYGVKGVAISMVVSAFLGTAAMAFLFFRKFDVKDLFRNCRPFPVSMLKSILKIGMPSATEAVAYNMSQIVITFMITFLGTEILATRIYTLNITTFVYMLGLSIGQGTEILVGYMVGSRRNNQAYKMTYHNLKVAMLANFILSIVLIVFREPVFDLYTDNETIIQLGCTILIVDIFVELGRPLNHISNGSLRGAGDVKYPMVVNVLSMWCVGVALCYLFSLQFYWGLIGIWIAMGIDEWIRGLILILRWRSRAWELKILVKREDNK